MVLPLSPSALKIHAVEIEMKGTGVGNCFLKSRFKIEGEVFLSQTYSSPMAIACRMMAFGEYLNSFALPQNRLGKHARLHLSSRRCARMTQS